MCEQGHAEPDSYEGLVDPVGSVEPWDREVDPQGACTGRRSPLVDVGSESKVPGRRMSETLDNLPLDAPGPSEIERLTLSTQQVRGVPALGGSR
jgi:hypothetical protein